MIWFFIIYIYRLVASSFKGKTMRLYLIDNLRLIIHELHRKTM